MGITYSIKHDVLAPQHEIIREFACPHPSKLLKFIPDEMKFLWRLESSMFFEDKIKWSAESDPIMFYGEWRGKVGNMADYFTVPWVKIRLQGFQSKDKKQGTATVWITGWLQTQFEYSNMAMDAFRMIYLRSLYQKQIHTFIEKQKDIINKFDIALREFLEVHKQEK